MTKRPSDPLGDSLDATEGRQRELLGSAEERVRAAVDALRPFEVHEGRQLPGLEAAVRDVRAALTQQAANLATIVTLHLSGHDQKPEPTPPISASVDHSHLEVVRAAKDEEAA